MSDSCSARPLPAAFRIAALLTVLLASVGTATACPFYGTETAEEVRAGLFVGGTSLVDFGQFLTWTTLGNALGGTLFVAILKYSHASRGDRPGHVADDPASASGDRPVRRF